MNKKILKLAVPNIISNLTVPLLSSVDTALMGHLDHVYYLGAIAVGGMIFNFIYWGFGFLRMGTTGLTAQAFGRGDKKESIQILEKAVVVAFIFSIVLIIFQNLIIEISFILINTSEEVELSARRYFSIRILAAPATLGIYAFTGWFLGMQNAKYPLILAIITNIFNIIFNLIFIKMFSMNVDGVAWGTVCANFIGIICGMLLFYKSYRQLITFRNKKSLLNWRSYRDFFQVSRDIFIRTLLLIFAFSFFTAKSAEAGDLVLAANSILLNLWTVMSYGIDGFAFASESLIGRYIGARDRAGLKSAIIHSFAWGVGLGFLFMLIYVVFSRPMLEIFSNKVPVINLALTLMIWTQVAPVISSFCYMWDGIYIGATATSAMRNSMIISILIFYLPVYYVGENFFGTHALWIALTIFMLARGLTLTLLYKKEIIEKLKDPVL
jgi:MATE family multidrug resistance protein